MKVLSIETSCDETAVSIVEAEGDFPHATYQILGNALFSQVDIHREYGGVFPSVAKREHTKTLIPMLEKALEEADLLHEATRELLLSEHETVSETLQREPKLEAGLTAFLEHHARPDIDLIAVTNGPGLEPALWVGINLARSLAQLWDIPVIPIDHMEGHIIASVFNGEKVPDLTFPALALLISGGHTELVGMQTWGSYQVIGQTRDDAVGEAFDKTARMLGLPYPGGPEISKLAGIAREKNMSQYVALPRPMLDSGDFDFSFSGLKTAVLYATRDKTLSDDDRASVACEFEAAITEVLLTKTVAAVEEHGAKTLILGGGVSANTHIRKTFGGYFKREHPELTLYLPDPKLTTDNSVMIALAGHARSTEALTPNLTSNIKASGNQTLTERV